MTAITRNSNSLVLSLFLKKWRCFKNKQYCVSDHKTKKWSLLKTTDWVQSMKRLLHSTILRAPVLAVAFSAVGLSGCTSLRGGPEQIISTADARSVLSAYKIPGVFSKYQETQTDIAKRHYRDEVMYAYIQAIDSQYFDFRSRMGQDKKELSIGFDGAIIGLSALATIAKKSADELAAVSGAFAGANSSVDKNLYFDQSLPALVAAMDAERLTIRASIAQKMTRDAAAYPLTAAFVDINEYQAAGTLDHAVTVITDEAVKERTQAKQLFNTMVRFACSPDQVRQLTAGQSKKLGTFNFKIAEAARKEATGGAAVRTNRDALESLASFYGIKLPDGMDKVQSESDVAQADAMIIQATAGGFCTQSEIDNLFAKLKAEPKFSSFVAALN